MKTLIFTAMILMAAAASAFEYDLVSGDYRITVTESIKHTIRKIAWKGYTAGTPTGYYGAIVVPAQGKYIGAGHKEGGAEVMLSCTVTCDGKAVVPEAKMEIKGQRITVEKISRFDHCLFRILLVLTPEGLIETKRFITEAEQPFHLFYAHIYCFDRDMTDYFALKANGKTARGHFEKKQKYTWHVNSEVKYLAEYNAAQKKGVMLYYPEVIAGAVRKATIWEVWNGPDKPGYNKFYMMTKVPKKAPAGWKSPTYTVILRGFEAEDADGMQAAVEKEAEAAAKIAVEPLPEPAATPQS
ncbi:MAG: hypothetical protein IJS14_05680 [Lentisphaeria bacterium]|nr:hypothetical protein [Lentisphaeria bacterium]